MSRHAIVQIVGRAFNQFKSWWLIFKSLPIGFLIGMICVPVGTTLITIWFNEGAKDRRIESQTANLISLRTELNVARDNLVNLRNEFEMSETRERLLERQLSTQTTVELGLQQKVHDLQDRLNSKNNELAHVRNERDDINGQLKAASEYIKELEKQVVELQATKTRLATMLRDRSRAEQRNLVTCSAGNNGTYKIAGLRVPATILQLNLTGRRLVSTDIEKIGCLRVVRSLTLSNIESEKLNFLAFLKDFSSLTLYDSQIDSFEFLIGADNLKFLNLRGSAIESFAGIEKMISLHRLSVANVTGRPDLDAISKIPGLRSLDLSGTHPVNFRFLADITTLQELFLTSTINVELADLGQLKNLHYIRLPSGQEIGGSLFSAKNRTEVHEYLKEIGTE